MLSWEQREKRAGGSSREGRGSLEPKEPTNPSPGVAGRVLPAGFPMTQGSTAPEGPHHSVAVETIRLMVATWAQETVSPKSGASLWPGLIVLIAIIMANNIL